MSPIFVRTLGTLEVLGAIGLVLPWLTGIKPRLTVAAALCLIVLQVLAIGLHVSRGEFGALGLNAVLIALAAFVFWGRGRSS
jgi:DoxX-like family